MKKREYVSKIMATDLITVNTTNTLFDVKEIFETKKVRHIPVVSGNKVIGMLSKTDFNRASYGVGQKDVQDKVTDALFHSLKIEDVMTPDPIAVDPETTIHSVAETFAEHQFHALPVVKDGEIKGIVTTTDIIKYLLEMY